MRNLKDYILEYKQGNYIVFNELIGTTKQEIYKDNKKNSVDRLLFNDKALNSIYWSLNWKYYSLSYADFDSYVSNAIFSIDKKDNIKSIFDNVDLEKSPQQILKYIAKKLDGEIYNQGLAEGKIKIRGDDEENHKKSNKPIFENDEYVTELSDDLLDTEVLRKSDKVMFDDYISVDDKLAPYEEFIEYIGGDVRNLLSDEQKKVYNSLLDVSLTQQDIADKLGITQQAVSSFKKAIGKRINKKYFEFMTLKRVASNRNTYRTIKGFLQQYQTIITYDTRNSDDNNNSFDYFGYIIQFLESVYIKNEETLSSKQLHRNKADYTYTIIDVVTDYINKNTYKIVDEYIFKGDTNLKLTQRGKDSFLLNIIKAFNKYLKDVEKAVQGLSEKVAKEGDSQKYINLLV
ncbi:hypothetical protein [Ornithinibacillus sp. 179-J 7C1 HS]|uniref:hypothetical protein n=1 Tax=Ornithinibacillus sp. 179-J 7C1 HS TaxID=3142384 RepID=UPI0039A2AA1D